MGGVSVSTFAEWRVAARAMLAAGVAPHDAVWDSPDAAPDLFGGAAALPAPVATKSVANIPRALLDLLEQAACFRDPGRWAFLYRVLWRWRQGEHDVASAADVDGARLHAMVKAVRREEHDMHAYVRFRARPEGEGAPRLVAWFEPAHDVLQRVTAHFAARMGRTSWMIATPEGAALWDGAAIHFAPPLKDRPQVADDAGEALWLTYYRNIFNPARLNTVVMQQHVRARFWKNLPEGAIVPAMVAAAAAGARRTGQAGGVALRAGTTIPIAAERAQPVREAPASLDECRRCELWRTATQAVAGAGPASARLMLVGEQPGDQEDLAGVPFTGPAGKLLDEALREAGIARDAVYVTNAVKHFKWEPRGKRRLHRTPAQREIEACAHWLERELDSVRPAVIVALGGTALKALLRDPSATLAGRLGAPARRGDADLVAVYHPAYILRLPDVHARREAMAVLVAGLRQALALVQRAGK